MKFKFLGILILITCFFSFLACSKESDPKDDLNKYVKAWQAQDFSAMYKYLSESSRKEVGEKEFVQKYTNIYSGIEARNISVKVEQKENKKDKDGTMQVPFEVTMDTAAGQIKFSSAAKIIEEKGQSSKHWAVVWNSAMILPDLAQGEKIRVDRKPAERGELRDRHGNPLAVNDYAEEIGVVPEKLKDGEIKKQIAAILNISVDQIEKKMSAPYVKPDTLVPIDTLSREDADRLSKLQALPGVVITNRISRVYPLKEKAAHLTGYVQKVSGEELAKLSKDGYHKDDVIGKEGLEKAYEKELRGEDGVEIYIVDKAGNKKKTLAQKEVKDGKVIRLTIDCDIQTALYDELKEDAGVAVAMHPKTGEVLALVSTPAYDPNRFILGMSEKEWKVLNDNPKKPFLNRFQNIFCPGSTIKPITAALGLNTGKIDPNQVKKIDGLKWQKDKGWGNYFITRVEEYNGPCNLENALKYSDNIYFAQSALEIGKDTFEAEIKKFGVGEKLPFDYPTYNSQLSADGKIKNEVQLADSGYGQGEFLMNPIHVATIFTSFVNEGNIIMPYLQLKENPVPTIWKEKVFAKDVADRMLHDLTQIVADPGGTGHGAFMKDFPLAGKTGTAEIKKSQQDTKGTELGWFEIVNTNNPKLLVVAMIEDVKERGGSHYVVPKVAKIMDQFGR